jgi:hypothetical protein
MNGVRYFRNIIFALAAFLWLPASAHCQLESIPGLEFLRCVSDTQNSQGHCNDSGCCSAEKSQFKTEQHRVSLPSPDFIPVPLTPVVNAANSLAEEVSVGVLTAAPPQLLKTWHFASRTALPARAPSITS